MSEFWSATEIELMAMAGDPGTPAAALAVLIEEMEGLRDIAKKARARAEYLEDELNFYLVAVQTDDSDDPERGGGRTGVITFIGKIAQEWMKEANRRTRYNQGSKCCTNTLKKCAAEVMDILRAAQKWRDGKGKIEEK